MSFCRRYSVLLAIFCIPLYLLPNKTEAGIEGDRSYETRKPQNESVLSISLVGTIISNIDSHAMIEEDGTIRKYAIGDNIKGWNISEINSRSIKLKKMHQVKIYRLGRGVNPIEEKIPKDPVSTKEKIRLEAIARSKDPLFAIKLARYKRGRPDWEVRYPMGVHDLGVNIVSDNLFEINFDQVMDGVMNKSYLNHVLLEDAKDKIQFSEVVPGSLIEQLGFIQGDSILRINELKLKGISSLLGIYQELKNKNNLNIEYVRDGRILNMQLLVAKNTSI